MQCGFWKISLEVSRVKSRERERESKEGRPKIGIPIGNLTSQLFANVYMNELDQFVKHTLRVKHYARYTDDFVIVSQDKGYLEGLLPKIESFLKERLCLELHPEKVFIRKYRQGIDFLGYVIRPHCIVPRTKTKQRIWKKLKRRVRLYKRETLSEEKLDASLWSYLGVLSHGDAHELREKLKNGYWFWLGE